VGEEERKRVTQAQQRRERYTMQRQVKVGTHPAILSQGQYEKAMAARKERVNPGRASTQPVPRTYLLGSGLACCVRCGDPLRCTNTTSGEHYLYYRCTAQLRGKSCQGSQRHIRERVLERQIDAMVAELTLPSDWRQRIQQLLDSEDSPDHTVKERRRKELREELRRIGFQHQKDLLTDDEYVRQATPVKAELDQLERQVVARVPERIAMAGEQLITFQSSWGMANKAQKRDMLQLMLDAVYVDTDERQIVGYKPHPDFELLFKQTSMREIDGKFIPNHPQAPAPESSGASDNALAG
jgi:hypothetical protein